MSKPGSLLLGLYPAGVGLVKFLEPAAVAGWIQWVLLLPAAVIVAGWPRPFLAGLLASASAALLLMVAIIAVDSAMATQIDTLSRDAVGGHILGWGVMIFLNSALILAGVGSILGAIWRVRRGTTTP